MTLLSGDLVRLCVHPRTVAHPLPALIPAFDSKMRIVRKPNPKPVKGTPIALNPKPLRLVRCLECGTVGELGT